MVPLSWPSLFLSWSWWQQMVLPFCGVTLQETGPVCLTTDPGNHFGPFKLFFTNTFSPTEKERTQQCKS